MIAITTNNSMRVKPSQGMPRFRSEPKCLTCAVCIKTLSYLKTAPHEAHDSKSAAEERDFTTFLL